MLSSGNIFLMIKKSFSFLFLLVMFFLISVSVVVAAGVDRGFNCVPGIDTCNVGGDECLPLKNNPNRTVCQPRTIVERGFDCSGTDRCKETGDDCLPLATNPNRKVCQPSSVNSVFGKIKPPDALLGFIGTDQTGEAGISKLLTNIIALFYSLAAVVLIFMLVWGAWDWLTAEGDKEKLESAKKKIINAIIGIMLFAVAFAIISVLGQFTGFKFFVGQKP